MHKNNNHREERKPREHNDERPRGNDRERNDRPAPNTGGKYPGVFKITGKLATRNLVPGEKVYGEDLVKQQGDEYRLWDPTRSKLGAALVKGIKNMPIAPGAKVLYLGAANGTTVSHVSDILGEKGEVYALEFSPRAMRDLIFLCEKRSNIYPVLADARLIDNYREDVPEVDVIFADVADRDQTNIALHNAKAFHAKYIMIAIKARCIDSIKHPREVYQEQRRLLEKEATVTDFIMLDPFEIDHCFIVAKMK